LHLLATDTHREAGVALPAVILVIALLTLLAIGSVRTVGDEVRSSWYVRESAKAFYAAEAGVEYVMANWETAGYDSLLQNPGDTLDLGWIEVPKSRAVFRAQLERVDDGSRPAYGVRVLGRSGIRSSATRAITTLVTVATSRKPFEWAIYGDEEVVVNHDGKISGPVTSNGTVKINGNGEVTGRVRAGENVIGQGKIKPPPGRTEKEIEEFSPPGSLPTIDCPSTAYGPKPASNKVTFDAATGNISIQGGPDIILDAGTYYFHNFSKKGDNALVVPAGDTAIVYISGSLYVWGDGFSNPSPNTAASLQVYGCGNDTSPWELGGDGEQSMVLYAPTHPLELSSDGEKSGAYVAGRIVKNHDGEIVFDSTVVDLDLPGLAGTSSTGAKQILKGSWAEF
jgi:hypothetical protein